MSPAALLDEWARQAAERRERAVRERLRQWSYAWGRRLEEGVLTDHLDDAARLIAAARAELAGNVDQGSPLVSLIGDRVERDTMSHAGYSRRSMLRDSGAAGERPDRDQNRTGLDRTGLGVRGARRGADEPIGNRQFLNQDLHLVSIGSWRL